jgi:hypothetical protein
VARDEVLWFKVVISNTKFISTFSELLSESLRRLAVVVNDSAECDWRDVTISGEQV